MTKFRKWLLLSLSTLLIAAAITAWLLHWHTCAFALYAIAVVLICFLPDGE